MDGHVITGVAPNMYKLCPCLPALKERRGVWPHSPWNISLSANGPSIDDRRVGLVRRAPPFLAPAGLAANNVVIDTLLSLSLAYLLPNLNIASAKNGALITICPWLEFVVLLFRSDPQIWVKDDRAIALLIFYSPETMMTLVSGMNRIFSLLASFFWDFYFMLCLSLFLPALNH